ncbi:acetyl-CoA synthetase-like protein [Aspergillus uvarum CBS 121591]|uniref:Acetyl-CoA synthetase-like protein n=1 Tax=Aspergillus uvarum CBS 121591 TaxID=1448315 RepID=A0A319CKP1_9EURO|nr:acetyl-CoA synthetase-like protein [Aspergillus uvarum CBS 121591]PYH86146.1 acetyl-CoA synthetase-like protein [Aspergillus uvarum CBS 121591]
MRSEHTHHAAASALAAAMIAELRTDETFLSLRVQKESLCNALQSLLMEYSVSRSPCILQYVLDIPPGLDLIRLKAAWNCVVASCEILRTRIFSTVKGAIQTVVEESSSWDYDNSLPAYLSRDLKLPMGYGSPLSRWGIIGEQKEATERFMVLSLHQSIHDDRTVTVLLERLCREYEALGEGGRGLRRHVPQISLDGSVQPSTTDQDAKNELIPAWWKAEAVRDSLTGGVDWVSQQVCASSVVEHEAMIPGLNMSTPHFSQALYSAWAIVISTYAQASDVTFGTVVSHRDQSTYDGVSAESTSPEIALLPVRISVEQADTTMQLLDQVSKIDYSHKNAEMPWTESLASLICIRDPVPKAFRCGDQTLSLFRPTTRKYPCPLVLECHGGQYLRVVGHFDESIFTTQRVRCLLQQFVHVVRQLSISSHSPRVQDVEVLSPEDKQQIWEWNGRSIPSVNRCLHHIFEEVAARHPNRIAVNAWDGVLTYQQLNEQSTRLAHQLQKIGVGPEIIVALYLDKSKQVPVSILGVQKAGGACLTFDTQQPVSRLRSILSDGGIGIMLADRSHVSLCESLVPRVICVDEEALKSLPQSLTLGEGALRTGSVQPFNRAFVLYTSGSTGTPKGIDVPHSAMCTSTLAFAKAFNVSSDSRIFQYSSYGFDVSAGDMFLAVLQGACLCIPSEYDRVNQLEHSICHLKANWLCTTPSVLGLLDPDSVPCLETLAIGGEALPKNITLQWAPRLRFHTGYGPSETGVMTSVLEVKNNQHPYSNVGRAMACHHWIVSSDDCNRLAPLGCPGELVIEGPTVSRGYLNRPELTARVFPRQPAWFDRQVGPLPSRFYRTGDIARHNDDGTLIFLGRRDSQIKYHGQRIELGDIEFSINQHELVREAVVLYPSDGPYAGRLTAVVALDKDLLSSPSSDEAPLLIDPGMLQRQLEDVRTSTQTELPPYMWPTEWLLMSRPFLNMNGKLNRKEILNSVKKMAQEVSQTKQQPADASHPLALSQSPFIDESEHLSQGQQVLQMQCSAILQLHRSKVPMESTFVSLGGDSLMAIQLVTACRKKGVEIDVRDILRGVRLRDVPCSAPELSRAVSLAPQQPGAHAESCAQGIDMFDAFGLSPQSVSRISGIPSHDIQAIYPCLSMQRGILTSQSRDQTLYQTAHVFEITGCANQGTMWDMQKIISAWRVVIERHDALRAVFLELPTHTEPFAQKDGFISSIPHQHVSLGDIWHAVGKSGVGPFNTLISILNATGPELGIETKMTFKSLEVYDPTEYDLTVTSYLSPGLATVRFDYWNDKASSDSITRLAHTFRHVFQTAGSTLDSPLKSLSLISDMDFRQINDWNSNTPLAVEKCIHEVISSRSSTAPQSPAVCSWDGELTYREMDAISDTFAHSLRSMGVREEVAIPLCFPKSFWAVVAMIAILKAGGAIVPLDPSHPISRRLEICRQVKAQIILVPSDHSIQEEWSESQLRMVEISHLRYQQLLTEKPTRAGSLQIEDIPRSSPAHSAYIVFTSGTTGIPKGIVTEHGAFCSGVAARAQAIMRSSKTRILQFASFAFDTCLEDILTTLMQGGCVCVPSEQERLSDLPGAIRRMNVNTAELTPSVARLLQPKDVPSLKTMILGGEQVTADLIMQWSEAVTLINSYGPAECSVTSVVSPPALEAKDHHASNIGLGVGALTWVVDSQNPNQLVPIGAVGELLLEGPVLARGYHDRQDLTEANFITDPAWSRQSQPRSPRRFYRTGDLVQYAPDGTLVCLGRRDDQIKLHGQRIELDEIDSCLQLHYPERRLIVAFFSMSQQPWQTETDFKVLPLSGSIREEIINLQMQVASSLPIYMRPSLYIPASRIPTSTAGKKDRATLAKAVQTLSESQYLDYSLTSASGHHQSETPEQRMLQSLWSQLLKLPPQRIGIHDDFFQIGGDSILAMKLSSLVGKRETVLSVADVFRYPILREMAVRLTEISHSHPPPTSSEVVEPFSLLPCSWPDEVLEKEIVTACQVPRDNIEDVYPCSAVQEGLMALSMRQENAYIARLVYSIPPGTSLARLQCAWQLVASQHSLLRTRIMLSRRLGTLQVVLRADDADKDTVSWKDTYYSDLQSFLEEDKGVPMTYGSALSRCAIVTTPDQANFFVWTVHHALYDGWLLPTIMQRAAEAYRAPESAAAWSIVPFRCFIAYLETRDRSASDGYWTNQLKGFRQVEFPAGNMGSKKERRDMSKVYHRVRLGRRPSRQFTTAVILRAAWAFLISKYSESDDISFGVTLSGRTAPVEGIASIAGPTLTTVPVRVRIDSEQSVVEFLRNMQSQAMEMMPHEHTGLQRIRKLSQGCLEACDFQNLLVIQPADEMTESTAEQSVFGQPVDEAAANSHFHTYPLVLSCTFSEHEVDLEVIFDPTTISPAQAERLALHFDAIFQTFWLSDKGVTVGQVEMITKQDQEQIQTWNKEQPQLQPRLVHEVIEEQVLLHPDSEAVYAWDGSLTYRDLHRYSYQLARTLQMKYHVGPERLVPVLFEKSVWAVVAMLGVMMAGGGFVPLDVSHPLDRMNDIVAQCNADLALVSSETSGTPLCTASKLIVSENMFRGLDAGGHETNQYSTKIPDVRPAHYFPGLQPQFLDTSKQEPGDQTSERTGSPRDSSPRTPVSFSWHSAGPETPLAFDMLTPGSNMSGRAAQPDDSDLTESNRVQPQNVVYVIFTSGSTGKPKGVVIQHDQFCSGVLGPRQEALLRSEQSRVLQFASFSFDTSLEDIITTLFFGGCVCIPSENDRMNDIAGFINKSRVNTAHITPSFANTLSPQLVPGLKYLRLGGERMTPTLVDKWAPALELRNVYGPTETCITATCSGTVTTASDPIDIGRGVAALTWIVNPDNHHQLTPVGLVGELLVEGPLLARGYLGDINKTNASFITDPTWARTPESPKSPRRFYKTGDLVRYSEVGTLLYIGRKDTQVKIYGQRIEIGEIEDHLKKALLPQTIEMAVEVTSLQADALQRKVLVAFLCLDDSFNKDGAVLMSLTPAVKKRVQELTSKLVLGLSKTLPAYMIPSRYVPLRSMPRTLAGKADRRKLQHLLNSMSTEDLLAYSLEGGEKQPVESETEFQLQKLWAEVLSVDTMMIGSHDNFFRLGGDSITAIRLAAALRDEGMFLTVGDIFNHPELRHMAAQIDAQGQGTKQVPGATPGAHEDLHPFGLLAPSPALLFDLSKVWDIPEDTVQDVYPCTPLQIEMLAAEGRHSQSTYGSQAAYDLPLGIDLDRFKHAVETVFRHNDILRTRIVYLEPHGTVQVVTEDGGPRWEYGDDIDQLLTQGYSFGLGTSLVRVALCPYSHESAGWTFCLTMHHSLYDGWSLSLILQQVNEVYQSGSLSFQRPKPRFRDFIGHLGSLDPDLSSQYWASILSQSSGSSDLPSQNGTVEELDSVEEYHCNMPGFEQGGSRLEVTPAIVLRAAWALIITAYTGNSDVRFGLSVAGRNVPVKDIDQMVGPTLATIPCRLQINQDWTVEHFLNHVNQTMIAAIPHEHFGLQRIAKLGPDCSRCCDFNSLLVVQPQIPAKTLGIFASSQSPNSISRGNDQPYPVVVECDMQESGGWKVHVFYRKAFISVSSLQRIVYLMQHLVEQLYLSPNMRLADLSLVSSTDLGLVASWNCSVPAPVDTTMIEMLYNSTKQHADLPAIHAWDDALTYSQLLEQFQRLSHYLRLCGVQRGSFVPVVMPKSALYIISVLAVISEGAAFVPIDATSTPRDRMMKILEQCNATVVIASTASANDILESGRLRVLRISHQLLRRLLDGPPAGLSRAGADDPLYCIFTSGTTGSPKGVVVTHGAYASSTAAKQEAYELDETTRVLQFSSNAFDASIDDIFISLLSGSCLCVPSEAERRDNLSQFIVDTQVNYAAMTPTVARTLDVQKVSQCLTKLRLGGEKLTSADLTDWVRVGVNLKSLYGPTESCVCCSASPSLLPEKTHPANIGRGLACRTWIVDVHNPDRLAPIGAVGELVIEGPALAKQYLHDLERTSRAFINLPLWLPSIGGSSPSKSKGYRTGDMVRYSEDGSLIYVGRKDTQVKLRGMRLELEEVQHALRDLNLPGFQDLVVDVIPQSIAPDILAADILMLAIFSNQHRGEEHHLDAIRASLTNRLPDYMIPTHLLLLDSLPTSSSGKTDRLEVRRLAVEQLRQQKQQQQQCSNPDDRGKMGSQRVEVPMDTFRTLQSIWADILQHDLLSIGPNANFFHLGGDSILVMRLVANARAHSIDISSADVHKLQTLSAIVAKARLRILPPHQSTSPADDIDVTSSQVTPDLRLVSLELGIPEGDIEKVHKATDFQSYCLAQTLSPSRGWLNFFSYDLHGSINVKQLEYACHALVQRHEVLRARFVALHGSVQQVIPRYRAEDVHFQVHEGLSKMHSLGLLASLVHNDPAPSLNDVLVRFVLHIIHPGRIRLTMRISHAQYDGLSMPIILKDLDTLYNGIALAPPARFSEYVEESERLLSQNEHAQQFWCQLLQGSQVTPIVVRSKLSLHSLQKDYPLDQTTIRTIRLSRSAFGASITPATIIKAAWALVLGRLSQHQDVVFGHLTSTRPSLDHLPAIHEVVGPCLNVLPVRVQLHPTTERRELLDAIQQQYIDALPHSMLGFRRIIDHCTQWPPSTRLSSILQYQNLHQDLDSVLLGGATGSLEAYVPVSDAADLWMMVTPTNDCGAERLHEIKLSYSAATIPPSIADRILDEFDDAILFLQTPHASDDGIRLHTYFDQTAPEFPPTLPIDRQLAETDLPPRPAIIAAVKAIWEQVFGPHVHREKTKARKEECRAMLHTPFGPDPVSAAQLSLLFQQAGVEISPAEAAEYPTIFQQSLLWGYKMREGSR